MSAGSASVGRRTLLSPPPGAIVQSLPDSQSPQTNLRRHSCSTAPQRPNWLPTEPPVTCTTASAGISVTNKRRGSAPSTLPPHVVPAQTNHNNAWQLEPGCLQMPSGPRNPSSRRPSQLHQQADSIPEEPVQLTAKPPSPRSQRMASKDSSTIATLEAVRRASAHSIDSNLKPGPLGSSSIMSMGSTWTGMGSNPFGRRDSGQSQQSACTTISTSTAAMQLDKAKEEKMQDLIFARQPGTSAKVGPRTLHRQASHTASRTSISLDSAPDVDEKMTYLKWQVRCMLASQRFDWVMGLIILTNSITIGVQMTYEVEGQDTTVFEVLEHFFLLMYVSELALRFFSMGRTCLQSHWVRFDVSLVGLGVASTWIIEPILMTVARGADKDELLGPLLVLRILRLLRLARSVRLLVQFKTLWLLVRGLLTSAGTMVYTFMLLLLLLYVFACLGLELITKNKNLTEDEQLGAIVGERFSSISVIMLTLVQLVTLDDASQVYTPFVKHSPFLLGAYFMIFIIVVSISLMNLVTAVIVEGAIEQSKHDREVQKAYENQKITALIPTIKRLFCELDTDGSGELSLEEINSADENVRAELQKILKTDDLETLVELVGGGSGEINIDDFCNAITKTITSEEPIEFIRLKQQMQLTRRESQDVGSRLLDISDAMTQLTENVVNFSGKHDQLIVGLTEQQKKRQDEQGLRIARIEATLEQVAVQQKKQQDEQGSRIARMEATLEQVAAHILGQARTS